MLDNDSKCSSPIPKNKNAIVCPWHLISSIACGRVCDKTKLNTLPRLAQIKAAGRFSRSAQAAASLTASLSPYLVTLISKEGGRPCYALCPPHRNRGSALQHRTVAASRGAVPAERMLASPAQQES